MSLIDYIFYRIYLMYVLNLRFGTIFTAVLQLSAITFFTLLPIITIIGYFLSSIHIKAGFTIVAYLVIIFYFYSNRYYNITKIRMLLRKYKNRKEYNKTSFEHFVNIYTILCIPIALVIILFVSAPIVHLLEPYLGE